MASGLVLTLIHPVIIRPSATDSRGRRVASARASGGNNWWAPLFGWSPEPDYINGYEAAAKKGAAAAAAAADEKVEVKSRPPASSGRRFAAFTEDKARVLRMRTMETEAFHDVMYHSAIASRLASDRPRRPPAADN